MTVDAKPRSEQETGVVDPKRWFAQSVSGMVTHTSTCHVYRMDVCQMYAMIAVILVLELSK